MIPVVSSGGLGAPLLAGVRLRPGPRTPHERT